MKARELMTPDPEFMVPGDSIRDSARRMRDLDVGAMPVVEDAENHRLTGVITDRDIAVRHVADGCDGCGVQDHMSAENLVTVGPDEDIREVARNMRKARVRRIPVVDGEGVLMGIIAQADLATEFGPRDPEEVEKVLEEISRPAHPERT